MQTTTSDSRAKELEFEVSGHCGRTAGFCPAALGQRIASRKDVLCLRSLLHETHFERGLMDGAASPLSFRSPSLVGNRCAAANICHAGVVLVVQLIDGREGGGSAEALEEFGPGWDNGVQTCITPQQDPAARSPIFCVDRSRAG